MWLSSCRLRYQCHVCSLPKSVAMSVLEDHEDGVDKGIPYDPASVPYEAEVMYDPAGTQAAEEYDPEHPEY